MFQYTLHLTSLDDRNFSAKENSVIMCTACPVCTSFVLFQGGFPQLPASSFELQSDKEDIQSELKLQLSNYSFMVSG